LSGCYKNDIDDLKSKYDELRKDYQTIQNAFQNQVTVTSVVPTTDGYKITFSDGKTVELKQGINGADAPTIVDIVIQNGMVEFIFSNGDTISIPMTDGLSFSITDAGNQYFFQCGETKEFTITQSGVQNMAISKPDGWKVSVTGNKMTVTAPASANTYAERSGVVSIVALGNQATTIANMEVHARDFNYLIDFEGAGFLSYLAGPTSYGENLYSSFEGDQYTGYIDAGSGLKMMINQDEDWFTGDLSFEFSNGGIAISQWNDMTTEGYTNQCSVFCKDDKTGFGGYGGSKTFAVVNRGFGEGAAISFSDNATECTFDHFRVTNATYPALSMMNGDDFTKKFTYEDKDWFKLIITACDKTGNPTGTSVEFYLAHFRTATSPGIITGWSMVALTPLGNNVHTVTFDMQSSDSGMWGMNTPAYFCFDNLAIKKQ
jgi:hypothetical protein